MSRFSGLSNHARERRRWICASVGVTGIRRFYRRRRIACSSSCRCSAAPSAPRRARRDPRPPRRPLLPSAWRCLALGDVLQLDGVGLEAGDAAALVDDRLCLLCESAEIHPVLRPVEQCDASIRHISGLPWGADALVGWNRRGGSAGARRAGRRAASGARRVAPARRRRDVAPRQAACTSTGLLRTRRRSASSCRSSSPRVIRLSWSSYCEFESDDEQTSEDQGTATGVHSVVAYPPVLPAATLCYVWVNARIAGTGRLSRRRVCRTEKRVDSQADERAIRRPTLPPRHSRSGSSALPLKPVARVPLPGPSVRFRLHEHRPGHEQALHRAHGREPAARLRRRARGASSRRSPRRACTA